MTIRDYYARLMGYKFVRKVVKAIDFFTTKRVMAAASALTYSTILAIVPICAVVFSIARGFGYTKYIEDWFRDLLSTQPQASEVIIGFVNSYLEHTKSGLILGIGLVFMLYTVTMLARSVEQTFNDIWHVKDRRNALRTFTDYLMIFFLVPFIIILMSGISLFITTIVQQSDWVDLLGPVTQLIIDVSPIILMWIVFTVLYTFMPNTKVRFTCCLGPGLVATIAMQVLQFFYIHAQMFISNYNAIYGSFAALPLFMLWVQFSWTICLFGAELSYTNQNLEEFSYADGAARISHRCLLQLSVLLMSKICKRFADGEAPYSAEELKQEVGLPLSATRDLLYKLIHANLLTEIVDQEGSKISRYMPSVSLERLTVGAMVDRLESDGENVFPIDPEDQLQASRLFKSVAHERQKYIEKMSDFQLKDL